MTGYVYFIRAARVGAVKIGYSKNPDSRLVSLDSASAEPLELLLQAAGTKDDEKAVQNKFLRHHLRNEWFKPHPEIFQFIEAIKVSGALPLECRGNQRTKKLIFHGRPRNHRQQARMAAAA